MSQLLAAIEAASQGDISSRYIRDQITSKNVISNINNNSTTDNFVAGNSDDEYDISLYLNATNTRCLDM